MTVDPRIRFIPIYEGGLRVAFSYCSLACAFLTLHNIHYTKERKR